MNNPSVVHIEPQTARDTDRIRVYMRDCKVALHIGCKAAERVQLQTIIVNVEVEAGLPHHYQELIETRFDHVIDYSRLFKFATEELPRLGPITLLEVVAEKIIAFCFEDVRIQKVRVRLDKPEIYAGKAMVGIEMSRSRPGAAQ